MILGAILAATLAVTALGFEDGTSAGFHSTGNARVRVVAGGRGSDHEEAVRAYSTAHISWWGLTDAYSWISAFYGERSFPLLFDRQNRHKPAFDAVLRALPAGTRSAAVSPAFWYNRRYGERSVRVHFGVSGQGREGMEDRLGDRAFVSSDAEGAVIP